MDTAGNRLVRLSGADGEPRLGLILAGARRTIHLIAEREPLEVIAAGAGTPTGETVAIREPAAIVPEGPWHLLAPILAPEVWCAGVTYERSREARLAESRVESRDLYSLVYEAERPELFLKDAAGRRTVGPGQEIGVRPDSHWNVPEPELALVLDGVGEPVAVTIGNDVSSRDIEGANALYLPQAKVFAAACAIGPALFVPNDWNAAFAIELRICNGAGAERFSDTTSTNRLRRSFGELVEHLLRANPVPAGSILLTGTGIVPRDDVSLEPGDVVEITIPEIGTLRNRVARADEISAARAGGRGGVRPPP